MQPIRSYIVRLYRRDRHGIAGVVQDVRTGRSTAFSSIAGLWAALTRPARAPATAAPPDPSPSAAPPHSGRRGDS